MKPAPHITTRSRNRPYGVMGRQLNDLRLDGHIWLKQRGGIVVYRNQSLPKSNHEHICLVPREIKLERIPGLWAPPNGFEMFGNAGAWAPIDWIRDPKKLVGDPFVARTLFLRTIFYEPRFDSIANRWRAHDIWRQPRHSTFWPFEEKARLPRA